MQTDEHEQAEDNSPFAWPRWMLGEILQLHDLGHLLTRGLTRRAASMLARFLWGTEAIVRRLLLAAAFALKITARQETAQRRPERKTPTESAPEDSDPYDPAPPRASFRTFLIRGAPRPAARTAALERAIVPRPDLGVLPLDPLLRIGAENLPPRGTAGRRRTHAARGRLPLSAEEQERRFCLQKDRLNEACDLSFRPAPRRANAAQGRSRRRYFEDLPGPFEDRTLRPAGMLARRITALIRVLEDPGAAARRLAATLARRTNPAGRFLNIGCPNYARRPIDTLPRPPGREELLMAQAMFAAALSLHDTS